MIWKRNSDSMCHRLSPSVACQINNEATIPVTEPTIQIHKARTIVFRFALNDKGNEEKNERDCVEFIQHIT
jgi:hypothetical protein